jgi:UDP-glucose 4-epimerase
MGGQILVTGGTGLVGAPIVDRLLAAGLSLTLLSRRQPIVSSGGMRWIPADLKQNFAAALKQVGPVDAVVHAGACIKDSGDAACLSELLATNVAGSDTLLRWCDERAVPRIVFLSSLSVLRRPLQRPIRETDPVGPATPYGMSKLWSEEQLRRCDGKSAIVPIILRISSPIPRSFEALPATVVKAWIQASREHKPLRVFGSGSRSQDFVACSDVAEAVVQSLQSSAAGGVYHIGSGAALCMRDLAQMIAGFRNTPIVFEGVDPNADDRWDLSLEKARTDLGYTPKLSGAEAIESLLRTVL